MRRRSRGALLLVCAALLASERSAGAQAVPAPVEAPVDDAVEKERTSYYREGVALAEAGRWGEALDKFQRVVALRSAPRALLALAAAEEHVGRLVSAKRTYGKARDDARAQGDEALAGKAESALAALEPRIPRLALTVAADVAGAEARLDGASIDVSAQGVEIDPGVYHLIVSAAGRRSFEERVVISAGQRKEIVVELAAGPAAAPPLVARSPDAEHAPPPPARAGRPIGAWILGGAGLAAVAVGVAVRFHQRSVYDDAARALTADPTLRAEADRGNTARDRMLLGAIVAGAGAALVGAGALWWALAPSPNAGATMAVGGTF